MIRSKKFKKNNNQGNSFIMVVATLSFLAVLVAAILVAVALCYRLKAYDLNARDNFYYLEQAMDEIYAGVGSRAMEHLNKAYDDTIEVLVYFDPKSQSYVSMDDTKANKIMMNTYIAFLKADTDLSSVNIETTLNGYISNKYDPSTAKGKEGIKLSVESVYPKSVKYDETTTVGGTTQVNSYQEDRALVIHNLVLRREARYSTAAARKVDVEGSDPNGGDTFVQTITTDIVIGEPEFDIDFNTISAELSNLYSFALIADKGVEVSGVATKVNITGNMYAASDFYNKQYNIEPETKVTNYTSDKESLANGLNKNSMYSGLFVDQADVLISSDLLVVPGTIAAFDGSSISIAGANQDVASSAEVWADSIVMGGYSFLRTVDSDSTDTVGASINMRGNAYISDDLELNAKGSSYNHIGQYYGYNYATTDNRIFTDAANKSSVKSGGRVFSASTDAALKNGAAVAGQAHYNSSSIIINGENSSLNLASVTDLYIAGQAYIETAKTTSSSPVTDTIEKNFQLKNSDGTYVRAQYGEYKYNLETGQQVDTDGYVIAVKDGVAEYVEDKSGNKIMVDSDNYVVYENQYVYNDDGSVKQDSNGKDVHKRKEGFVDENGYGIDVDNEQEFMNKIQTTKDGSGATVQRKYTAKGSNDSYVYIEQDNDNYTSTANATNPNIHTSKTSIQDYATGEAVSIKSNQLAYIPSEMVTEDTSTGEIYFLLPVEMRKSDFFKKYWDIGTGSDISAAADSDFQIPVVKTVISGKAYYFFDFSTDKTKTKMTTDVMNQFMEDYANLFKIGSGKTVSEGDEFGLTDITNYDYFKVKLLKVNTTYDSATGAPLVDDKQNFTNIYSNSAITVLNGTSFTIKAKSDSINPLIQAAVNINDNRETQLRYMTDKEKEDMSNEGLKERSKTDNAQQSNVLSQFNNPSGLSNTAMAASLVTSKLQQEYKEVKYLLSAKSSDATGIIEARDKEESKICPINYYFNYHLINNADPSKNEWKNSDNINGEVLNSGYRVWLSDGDVNVDVKNGQSDIKGLIICMGDVTFDSDVTSFEGLIVTGSKMIINNGLNITSNEEVVKTILRECDEAQGDASRKYLFNVCSMFKHYKSIYKDDDEEIASTKVKDVSAVQFEDILKFDNWQKNVD